MNLRLAAANLARNRWRTALSVGGAGLATAFLIWMGAMQDAMWDLMLESVITAEVGHIQVHAEAYVDEPSLHSTLPDDLIPRAGLGDEAGVEAVAPRVHASGLLGHEKHSRVARIIGVDPEAEAVVTGVDKAITKGRWLAPSPRPMGEAREVVLGFKLAESLGVKVGDASDKLAVILQGADGSLGNDLVQVVGVVQTRNTATDAGSMFMHLQDAQALVALDGRVHELALRIHKRADPALVAEGLRGRLAHAGGGTQPRVRTWMQILPELQQMLEFGKGQKLIIYGIVFFIAALGILNAQRMSALERRREFGVLMAIGLTPRRLAGLLVAETALVSAAGGLVGLLLGGGMTLYHSVAGFVMTSGEGADDITFMGVNLGGRLFFDPTLSALLVPVVLVTLVGFVCGLWPAHYGSRLDPARAIAGRS